MARVHKSLVAFAFALSGATVASAAPAGLASASSFKNCGSVTVNGHTVRFGANSGVACSMVMKHAKVLAQNSLKSHKIRGKVTGGPSGWTCIGSTTSTAAGQQIVGNCAKGLGFGPGAQYFNWSGT